MLRIDESQCSDNQNLNNEFPKMAVARITISIAAFFLTASLFGFHTKRFAVHPNTRMIMKSHYILTLFNSVAQAVVPTYEIYHYAFNGSKCFQTTHTQCVLLTIWPYYAICAVGYSLTYISLERLYAYVLYRVTNRSPKRWVSYIFVFAQVIFRFTGK
uniref:G protein-coupled receptor n=1 Tax=Steinernema glaseri TaxID=37863 RepID=A0A1I7ZAF0_9BILA